MYVKRPFEKDELPGDKADDRRTMKRRHLIFYLRVWDRASGEVIGHVVDITTEGIMLIGEQELPLHKQFDLEIRWRKPGSEEDQAIGFRAETMWSSPDVNKAFRDTGLRLLDDGEEVLEPIRQLIKHYGFDD